MIYLNHIGMYTSKWIVCTFFFCLFILFMYFFCNYVRCSAFNYILLVCHLVGLSPHGTGRPSQSWVTPRGGGHPTPLDWGGCTSFPGCLGSLVLCALLPSHVTSSDAAGCDVQHRYAEVILSVVLYDW